MNYSHIISDFTWSYSRLAQFESCPYAFLQNYIAHTEKQPLFFSDYGSFVHKLLERYLSEELKRDELPIAYLSEFQKSVCGKAPSKEVFQNYFEQGLAYLRELCFPYQNPLFVEYRTSFQIEQIPFTGIIDCVVKDGDDIVIVDHKSRALKPRSARKKPTKSDEELDAYLRQLYLYCIPIKDLFRIYPKRLEFNCFRTGQLISEPFSGKAFEAAKEWAVNAVKTITENEDWSPKIEYWKCRYLCSFCAECEYFAMQK